MANSKRPQQASDNVDKFIKESIEEDFPLKVKAVLSRELDREDLLGLIQTEDGKRYRFLIEQSDPRPMLRRDD